MKFYLFFPLMLALTTVHISAQDAASRPMPVFGTYDPTADPNVQLHNAISEASASQRRILLEVGGEWCNWCHRLDTLFLKNPDLAKFLNENFLLVKINVSKENDNEAFLRQYPAIPGYPHFFVLDSNGTFLHSQDTGELEKGKGHDRGKMIEFLARWTFKK